MNELATSVNPWGIFMKEQLKKINVWFLPGLCVSAVFLCAVLLPAQSGGITTKDPKAKEAVDAALKAIGGTDKIGGIKSLVIRGTDEFVGSKAVVIDGNPVNLTASEFEIRILLPDSFINIRQTQSGMTIYDGVSRRTLVPPKPRSQISPTVKTPDGKTIQRSPERIEMIARDDAALDNYWTDGKLDEWSRFLIGTLMKSGSTPVTISSGSKSGVFTLEKKDGTLGEIEFDSKTGYPSVIRYKPSEQPKLLSGMVILGGMGGAMPGTTGSGQAKDEEIRFHDRFSVNGIMFPRVITMPVLTGIREVRIEEVLINPALSLKDFEFPDDYVPFKTR